MQVRLPRYNSAYFRDLDSGKLAKTSTTNKCLILDIDRTCLFTSETDNIARSIAVFTDPALQPLRDRVYNFSIYDAVDENGMGYPATISGTIRPYLREFLNHAFDYFKIVGIWSAGRKRYVDRVIVEMFRDTPRPPDIIFSFDDCTPSYEGIMGKPLTKMINSHPILKKYMSLENTLIVDDYPHSFRDNVDNGILIPPYNPASTMADVTAEDDNLLRIRRWLDRPEVRHSTDIRKVPKGDIFKIDAW